MQLTCSWCKKVRDSSEFSWKNKAKKIRLRNCKKCQREYCRKHYQRNSAVYRQRAKKRGAAWRREVRARILEYLSIRPCACGQSHPAALDFHHRDAADKVDTIAFMFSSMRPWDLIFKEIQKCDVICASCHRILTAEKNGWYSSIPNAPIA